jgi:glycosyltransferase involved in cell wall biosynthesis
VVNNMDLVSIVITVLNGQANIKRCLESVVNQTYPSLEIVIFDDGSTDATRQIILSFMSERKGNIFKFDYMDQNIGRSAALNKCLEQVTGKYIAIMDADDEMYPDRITQQVNYLNSNSSVSVVGGAQLMQLKDGTKITNRPPKADSLIKAGLFVRTTMLHPTVMIRREFLVRKDIKYNPNFHLCEDYKIFVDMLYAGAIFANLPNIVNTYDYSTIKGWDKHQDRMVKALGQIWSVNLRSLSIDDSVDSIELFLKLNGKMKVNGIRDVLCLFRLFLRCLHNNKFAFGTKGAFLIARAKDLRLMWKSI